MLITRFNTYTVKKLVSEYLDSYFANNTYEPESGEYMAVQISKGIRDKLSKEEFRRYKIIVKTFLGEKKDQKVIIMAKGYWDVYVDNYVAYTYHGNFIYCTVVVYGFYTD